MSSHDNNSDVCALKAGVKLGAYRIEHAIGSGGMAEVYYAVHEDLLRPAAIKVLHASLAANETHLQRFMQEARAAASLVHPNIVQVYDVGQHDQLRYIAQEYIPGGNLRQYLTDNGATSVRETISVLIQVLAALTKSEAVGIVHRDIKPENIMLTKDGDVKVADFGLARIMISDDPQLTSAGTTLGTPMYMSPEQIQEASVDIRSDLYSLGVTVFHMLVGRPPFTGETPLALAMQHVQAEPPRLDELRSELPKSLVDIVHRLLQKQPSDRFNNPTEVLDALRAARTGDLAEHWPDQTIPLSGTLAVRRGPSAATIMLQRKLSSERNAARKRWLTLFLIPFLCLAAWWIGWLIAGTTNRDLLLSSGKYFGVVQRETPKEQYADALLSKDNLPRQLEAVPEIFPPEKSELNRLYAGKAWLQLAGSHLERNDLGKARDTLEKIDSDKQMPMLIRVLSALRRAEIEEADGNPHLADEQLALAKKLAADESITKSSRDIIDQFVEHIATRLHHQWHKALEG